MLRGVPGKERINSTLPRKLLLKWEIPLVPLVLGSEDKFRSWLGEEEAGKGLLLDTDPISLAGHLTGLRGSGQTKNRASWKWDSWVCQRVAS